MKFEDMLTSSILAVINITFIIVIAYIRTTNKDKYPGLKYWLIGAKLQVLSAIMFVIREGIETNILNKSVTFAGNIMLILSYIIMVHSFFRIIGRKIDKRILGIIGFILSTLIFYATIITYNGTIIAIVTLISLFGANIPMLIALYCKKTEQQRLRWFPYSLMNSLSLLFVISYFIILVIIKDNPLASILLYDQENFLLKGVIIVATTNSIGIVTVMNSAVPSYVDLENDLFTKLFYNVPFMVIAVDLKQGLIRYVNPKFKSAMGYTEEEIIGKIKLSDLHTDVIDYQHLKDEFKLKKQLVNLKVLLKPKNNKLLHGSLSVTSMEFEEGTFLIGSVMDITKFEESKEEYKKLAMYDDLTKLPNRRPFMENFNLKVKAKETFCLIMLDIDNFKEINDIHGHLYGDKVLVAVAKKINMFNEGTDTVSRYGGDEFVILLKTNSKEEASQKVQEVLDVFKEQFKLNAISAKVDISIGYSCYPYDGKNITTLLDKADKALYKAKDSLGDFACKYDKTQM